MADYSAVDLLNDYQYFESFHYDEVSEFECEIEKFVKMEREKEEKSNLDSLSDEHRNILDIAMKAHLFMKHRVYMRPMQRKNGEKYFEMILIKLNKVLIRFIFACHNQLR